jgi:hypothetical protein
MQKKRRKRKNEAISNGEWRVANGELSFGKFPFFSQSYHEVNWITNDLYLKNVSSDHSPLATRHSPLATSLNCAPLPLFSNHAKR